MMAHPFIQILPLAHHCALVLQKVDESPKIRHSRREGGTNGESSMGTYTLPAR